MPRSPFPLVSRFVIAARLFFTIKKAVSVAFLSLSVSLSDFVVGRLLMAIKISQKSVFFLPSNSDRRRRSSLIFIPLLFALFSRLSLEERSNGMR
jgi:hypothetical protein